ncbi:MAG TPA: response regulator transcription factor [Methylomirabilota bacterium]|nr:response regulator transcription factor [Methylomirabilota bacterium]
MRLRALVEGPGIDIVGEGPTPEDAPSDVHLLLLGGSGLTATGLRPPDQIRPPAIVVVTSDAGVAGTLRRLVLRGWGVVSPDASRAELRAAVSAVAEGFTVLPGALASRLLGPAARSGEAPDTPVLDLLGQGLTNRLIGEQLGISEHTVKFHVAAICGKLGATTRTEAVSRGVRQGLIML